MSEGHDIMNGGTAITDVQQATLNSVLNLIIAPSDDGRMPGAAEYDVLSYIRDAAGDRLPAMFEELDHLEAHAQAHRGGPFASLGAAEARALIDEVRSTQPRFMGELAKHTVACYYQQDRVLFHIGMEARAPYPKGYDVESGDLSLLDPVRARGQIYRDAGDR